MRGSVSNDEAIADLMRYGASEADARLFLGEDATQAGPFLIWPCNAPAFSLFMALKTQWRHAPMGGLLGLDYSAIPPLMDLRGIKKKRRSALFDQIQTLEMATLAALRED